MKNKLIIFLISILVISNIVLGYQLLNKSDDDIFKNNLKCYELGEKKYSKEYDTPPLPKYFYSSQEKSCILVRDNWKMLKIHDFLRNKEYFSAYLYNELGIKDENKFENQKKIFNDKLKELGIDYKFNK